MGEIFVKSNSLITSSNEVNAGVTGLDKGVQALATGKYASLCCKRTQEDVDLALVPSALGLQIELACLG